MTREEEMLEAVIKEHGELSKREISVTLTAMEWADRQHGKELMYVIQKTGERTKREVINKACEWLKENIDLYSYTIRNVKTGYTEITLTDVFETAFRKAMEE